MRTAVFIQTNAKQLVGALVSAHSLRRSSKRPEDLDVRILRREDFPFFEEYEGRALLRGGKPHTWRNDDLQSFTPLRFMPPELMGYGGRALVIDPDVFAVGDVTDLLTRDMGEKAILARPRPRHNNRRDYIATSVMLLDCARLTHWRCRTQFDELFAFTKDYDVWMSLGYEPRETIGALEPEWNDFDHLTERTRLLHTTKRRTQPWKKGLPIDYTVRKRLFGFVPLGLTPAKLNDRRRPRGHYWQHPDKRQEAFFFALLRECLDSGQVNEAFLRSEMAHDHIRHDTLELLARAPALSEVRI